MRPDEWQYVADPRPTALSDMLARIPVAAEALRRIPHVPEFQNLPFGKGAAIWDCLDPSDLTTKMFAAGLQLEIEAVQDRLDEVEAALPVLAEIEQKYEVARAAERAWRPMIQARTSVVFRNDAGDVATMSVDLVRLIASKGTFDGDVVAKPEAVQFRTAGEVIAEIPKTLFVSLEKILETSQWNA
ncbi:MAG: hypothetical protein ACRELB_11835, partial [Polyangiaceae bacterium]